MNLYVSKETREKDACLCRIKALHITLGTLLDEALKRIDDGDAAVQAIYAKLMSDYFEAIDAEVEEYVKIMQAERVK